MKDLTRVFYDLLQFPVNEIFRGANDKNRIKQIGVIIVGATGTGKTTLAKNVTERAYSWYGKENCSAVYTNSLPLGEFIKNVFVKSRPVQVLIYDDATGVKVSGKEQRVFFSLRHLMEQDTGLREGIIYTIYITHDWYALDKTFRRNALFTVFLSVPRLDKYSRDAYKKFIGKEALDELTRMTFEVIKHDDKKGKGIGVLPTVKDVGYILWDDIDFPLIELREVEEIEEY